MMRRSEETQDSSRRSDEGACSGIARLALCTVITLSPVAAQTTQVGQAGGTTPQSLQAEIPVADNTAVEKRLAFEIGPIGGITGSWHSAPAALNVPDGTMLQFKFESNMGYTVLWVGAQQFEESAASSQASVLVKAELGTQIVRAVIMDGDQLVDVMQTDINPTVSSSIGSAALDLQPPQVATLLPQLGDAGDSLANGDQGLTMRGSTPISRPTEQPIINSGFARGAGSGGLIEGEHPMSPPQRPAQLSVDGSSCIDVHFGVTPSCIDPDAGDGGLLADGNQGLGASGSAGLGDSISLPGRDASNGDLIMLQVGSQSLQFKVDGIATQPGVLPVHLGQSLLFSVSGEDAGLAEWTIDGNGTYLGSSFMTTFTEPGYHDVHVGPPGREAAMRILVLGDGSEQEGPSTYLTLPEGDMPGAEITGRGLVVGYGHPVAQLDATDAWTGINGDVHVAYHLRNIGPLTGSYLLEFGLAGDGSDGASIDGGSTSIITLAPSEAIYVITDLDVFVPPQGDEPDALMQIELRVKGASPVVGPAGQTDWAVIGGATMPLN